jgi:formylglycine-generating enzyme required for sulfatase activity
MNASTWRDLLRLAGLAAAAAAFPILARADPPVVQSAKAPAAAQPSTAAQGRPNLVFVFSDQQSFDMLGCYGNREIITPHLDALATEGVRFNHCISSQPVCTPYRGMLLTGQHPLRCGAFKNDVRIVPGEGRYFGEVLRDAGYRLGYFGKWHLYGGDRNRPIPPGPFRYGFDHDFLSNNCTLLFDAQRAYYWDERGQKRLYGDWEPYAQTRQAMRFIEENAARPFALFLSWHPPHNWPSSHGGYDAPKELLQLYDPDKLTLRPNVKDTPRHRQMYQGYMAMCTGLDRALGDLMQQLKAKGLAENTIVVYTSDHGDMLMSHGWPYNKSVPEIESCRVPLLVRWPGGLKPRTSDLLFGTLDFMPTLLALMGIKAPETCQGRNLADAIRTARDDAVESVPLFHFSGNWRGIYTRRHTYAFDLSDREIGQDAIAAGRARYACLYDHDADPRELHNLYDAPEHRPLRDKLHAQTRAWMKQFGDTGMTLKDLAKRVMVAEDIGLAPGRGDGPFGQGRLKGRPLDVLSEQGGKTQITNSIGMKLVLIPAGEFKMGSGESAEDTAAFFNKTSGLDLRTDFYKDEHPQHRVRITKPFYLGTYHVTRGQFRQFVADTGYKTNAEKGEKLGAFGWDPDEKKSGFNEKYSWQNVGFEQTDEHPVVCVSWNDAVAFCKWLSRKEGNTYRLPTEAEWEYSCRAGTTTRYYSGDDPETLAKVGNVADAAHKAKFSKWKFAIKASDGYVFTAPVGSFRPNAFGLCDMHGNAWQWCADWCGKEYYAASPADDPTGPDSGDSRVIRGGSWYFGPLFTRSAKRIRLTPDNRDDFTGFRVARTP